MPTCTCRQPPGEHACPKGFAAFCEARNGKCVGRCSPVPPSALRSEEELARWAFSQIHGREFYAVEMPPDWAEILASGEYLNPETGQSVRFSLPERENRAEQNSLAES